MIPTLRPLAWLTAALAGIATTLSVGGRPPVPSVLPVAPAPKATAAVPADGPPVRPGLVRWHPTFSDAQVAAQASGRPVLLFHLMGRLDHQFC